MAAVSADRFQLRLRHGYYGDEVCNDLEVLPSQRTQRLLDRARWRWKTRANGLSVFGSRLVSATLNEPLCVFLLRRNPEFELFTAPPAVETRSPEPHPLFLFRPKAVDGTVTGEGDFEAAPGKLAPAGPMASGRSAAPAQIKGKAWTVGTTSDAIEALALPNLAGVIELPGDLFGHFPGGMAAVRFQPQSAIWQYKIQGRTDVTIIDTPDGNLSIDPAQAKQLGESGGGIRFKRTEAGSQSCTLTSEQPLSCAERPQRIFVLCENASGTSKSPRRLMILPSPPLRSLNLSVPEFPTFTCLVNLPTKN